MKVGTLPDSMIFEYGPGPDPYPSGTGTGPGIPESGRPVDQPAGARAENLRPDPTIC